MTVSRRLSVGTKHCLTYSTKVSPFHWPFENDRRPHPSRAQAGHEGNCFPMPVRRVSDQSRAARTATSQPPHIGAGGGLVDKDKPRRIKQNLALESSAGAHGPRPLAAARQRTGFFLKLILWRRKKRPTALRLPGIPAAFLATTTSSNVKSGHAAIRFKNHFACFSNRDTLPPLGFAAALPVSHQRRSQLMTELGLTSKCSATSRREAPDLTSSIARSRKSSEYGLSIEFSPANQNAVWRIAHCSDVVNPLRFDHTGIRSRCSAKPTYQHRRGET